MTGINPGVGVQRNILVSSMQNNQLADPPFIIRWFLTDISIWPSILSGYHTFKYMVVYNMGVQSSHAYCADWWAQICLKLAKMGVIHICILI